TLKPFSFHFQLTIVFNKAIIDIMHFDTSRPFFRPRRAQRVALAPMSVGALAFVSACSTASSDEAADSDTLNIVASTSIWGDVAQAVADSADGVEDRKSTRLNSSHVSNSYAVFCLKKKIMFI